MVDSGDFRLKEIFCGMRSSSRDHFPLVGEIIDSEFMLENYPKVVCGAKAPLKGVPISISLKWGRWERLSILSISCETAYRVYFK